MRKLYMPQLINCQSCQWAVTVQIGYLVPTEFHVQQFASEQHRENGKNCFKPLLSCVYVNVMVSNEIASGVDSQFVNTSKPVEEPIDLEK